MTTRVRGVFDDARRRGGKVLVPFLTAGYPDAALFLRLAGAAIEAGADLLEIGVPFSDPVADGPTIQRASAASLGRGTRLDAILEWTKELGAAFDAPLLLMGYANPFLARGARLAERLRASSVAGLIVPDLPPGEDVRFDETLAASGLSRVHLVAPNTPDRRIREASRLSTGFLYCVSVTGVTGARRGLPLELGGFLERVRTASAAPFVVGFGISDVDSARQAAALSDGVVAGSALIDAIDAATGDDEKVAAVRGLVGALRRALG